MMKIRNNYRIRKASSTVFFELILIVLGFFFLMPFIFMLRTAFHDSGRLLSENPITSTIISGTRIMARLISLLMRGFILSSIPFHAQV